MTDAREQANEAFERGRKLNQAGAEELQNLLQQDPANVENRFALVAYLTESHFEGANVDEVRRKRAEHIFWLIEHVPDHPALDCPECFIFAGMDPHYEQYKELWLRQIQKYPSNPQVLGNAASGFFLEDGAMAEQLLLKAESLAPDDPNWANMLSVLYEMRGKQSSDPKHWDALSTESKQRCEELRRKRNAGTSVNE